jgi:Tol biopolymer transport system component
VRTGGNAFALTDRGELVFVRRGSAMSARYADGQLAPSELLEAASAVTGAISSTVALASASTFAFVPSPDSTRRSLVWVSPDGSQAEAGFGRRDYGGLSLSPDGRRAAISLGDGADAALYLADANGGALTLLTKPAAWTPVWSPDGKWIAGSVDMPNTSGLRLARVAVEAGSAWQEVYNSETTSEAVAQWTPDGRSLFFSAHEALTGRRSIARVVLDGNRAAPSVVVDGTGQRIVQFPAMSPDGRWLAYESNESGRAEVYVQSYPSPDIRVQVSQDGGTRPTWARDGTAIYVVTGAAIVSRTVIRQPQLRFGAARTVVNDPLLVLQPGASWKSFDVAPDGRFLVIKEDDSVRSDHIVVVQNWRR